jgi:opacity protein-like surface antigen
MKNSCHKVKATWFVKVLLVLITYQSSLSTSTAQTEPEYRLELGGGVGMVSYEGDFNSGIFSNPQPMFSLLAKYKFNPRMAVAMNVSYGQLKGSAKKVDGHIPAEWTDYSFKNNLVDTGLRFEYNFWPFGTGMEYRGAQRLTPYIFLGLGMTVCKADKTETALNLPVGAGVKYKVADRWNMALEWAMHFTSSDLLDGVKDPYGINSSGLFKNTDCYSQLRLSVTYDLWAKCKTCHNDRD